MNVANKIFRNNRTGETIKVIDAFENIAILENKQKIDVRSLLDINQYTEQIDPSSFFNNQDAYNALAEKLKSIPTENLVDDSLQFGGEVMPVTNDSAIIQTTEEDERAELARKYGASLEPSQEAIVKQQQAFSKYLGEEEIPQVTRVEANQKPMIEQTSSYIQPEPIQRVEVQDPITTMFKNVKRNVEFKVNFQFNDKVPRLDFIEMMEDSYELSIIDFLADEFTSKILNDPSKIRENIKNEIEVLVYGENKTSHINNSLEQEIVINKKEVKNPTKPTSKERIEIIKKLNNISDIELQLKGEKSKAVIDTGNKRIEEIKSRN
jgi:hypothetical protein